MTGPRMWPAILPSHVRKDPYRNAEVKVYDQLEKQLDSGWTVFYSRPWLGLTATGGEKDGECDFVVVHANHGFLAIEVKGGGISYDPLTDCWMSRDRNSIRHRIKNPVEQARSAKHELLKRVTAQRDWPKNRFIRARHGVIFPDVERPPENLGADRPRHLFCCRSDMVTINDWVADRLSGGDESELGKDGVRAFEKLLALPFTLRVPLGHSMDDDDRAIEALTPEQFYILDSVAHLSRVAVGGSAGTGKTIVAMEDAMRMAEAGRLTLLTCLSEELAQHMRLKVVHPLIQILSFPALCLRSSNQKSSSANEVLFSAEESPERMVDDVAENPSLAFNAIVVDEAQDFHQNWWVALESILLDPINGQLHAFYDTNQKIYGNLVGRLATYAPVMIRLSRNLRNTKLIHSTASRFYQGLPVTAYGPDGVQVEWVECSEDEIFSLTVTTVKRLCFDDLVSPADLTVLVATEAIRIALGGPLKKYITRGVTVATVRAFKGLEKKAVVVVATREFGDDSELAYVALSRPRTYLAVLGEPAILDWLKAK
jgi:hypothetical protein